MATMVGPTKQLTKDSVCGMQVDPAKAISVDHNGEKFYFCSQGCATKFQGDPDKYLQKTQAVPPKEQPKGNEAKGDYTCPMHPEIHQPSPGSCPKCGMALEPAKVEAPATKTQYTCPMHPQIIRDEPGSCPICGMTLEPMTVTLNEANPELDSMMRRLWFGIGLTVHCLLSWFPTLCQAIPSNIFYPVEVWAGPS
jgi:Cu+-exporting ATPase